MNAKICRSPNCSELINQNEVYCEKHKKPKLAPFQNAVRHNEELYNTKEWRKLRKQKIQEMPFCSKCGINENLQVHHIVAPRGNPDLFYNESNLTVVCEQCHRLITQKEIAYRKSA
jgi:5-methylcytosine-specific restriction endonuclease McrA